MEHDQDTAISPETGFTVDKQSTPTKMDCFTGTHEPFRL